jgi:hypothetical protein
VLDSDRRGIGAEGIKTRRTEAMERRRFDAFAFFRPTAITVGAGIDIRRLRWNIAKLFGDIVAPGEARQ